MFKVKLLAVGGMKQAELSALASMYLTRLRPYCAVEVVEVVHEPFTDAAGAVKSREREAERLLKVIGGAPHYVLDERGKDLTSAGMAKFLQGFDSTGETLVLVIGGTSGLDARISTGARGSIRLSSLTFPHELARVILLEQIYRGMKILRGEAYHY